MDDNSNILISTYLYNINNIPICLIKDSECLLQLPKTRNFLQNTKHYLSALQERKQNVSYLTTQFDALFGLVRTHDNLEILVGPYFTYPVSKENLPKIYETIGIQPEEQAEAEIFLLGVPFGPLHRFLSYLACINYCLNQSVTPIEEIDMADSSGEQERAIQSMYTTTNYESRENDNFHNTYLHELHRMELIAAGNTDAMRKAIAIPLPGHQGRIGENSLRQAKNIFIAACTIYTRAAIAGGLDVEEAYNLSDVYIQTSESFNSVSEVEHLLRTMPLDFTQRVEREAKYSNVSQPILDAIHYMREHVNAPIKAKDIAQHVNLSTSYFLKRFKTETGQGVSEFMTEIKVEEACSLLSYTDKTLTEISNYLYFSSQSYFQNVFKKAMGITPGQYRNEKRKPPFLNT